MKELSIDITRMTLYLLSRIILLLIEVTSMKEGTYFGFLERDLNIQFYKQYLFGILEISLKIITAFKFIDSPHMAEEPPSPPQE